MVKERRFLQCTMGVPEELLELCFTVFDRASAAPQTDRRSGRGPAHAAGRIGGALVTNQQNLAHQQNQPNQRQVLPNPLTAVTIALANNVVFRATQSRLHQATRRYAQSKGVPLAQVEGYASQAYLTSVLKGLGINSSTIPLGKSHPFGSFNVRFTLTQDLLNIANLEAWKSFRSKRDASRLMENAREIVVWNVVAGYLQPLRAKASRDALPTCTRKQ